MLRRSACGPAICSVPAVRYGVLSVATIGLVMLGFTQATALQVPTALRVGSVALRPASCASRDTLWLHHYVAALYVPPRESAVPAVLDPGRAKALHVEILSKAFLPKDVPINWRETLEAKLDGASFASVRKAWQELAVGDRITVAYAPGPGVSLQVNDRVVAATPRHDLVEAMLETWADGQPVRERLSRVVFEHPCRM